MVAALAILLSVVSPARAQVAECETREKPQVPGAEEQDEYCLPGDGGVDLTTKGLVDKVTTNTEDWGPPIPLHAVESLNPPEPVPGLQIDGYFPDDSDTNCNNQLEWEDQQCHDSQFVIRFPDEWNGKLVITGAPGNRRQYANDYIISDYVLSKGYAFASTDKGNTGNRFYEDGEQPGDAVAEWHHRVEQLTKAAKDTVEQWYGKRPEYTYITGISNGGYLTRYALENTPELYDGGVDWEGTLFLAEGPNLFTYLPVALRHYPECQAQGFEGRDCKRMYKAGFEQGSEFLWPQHYDIYWDLTQRIYREEFDPGYDGDNEEEDGVPGTPFCQDETSPPPPCDADYRYGKRPERVKDAVGRVSNTGNIGKKMITLHGTLDALLPIDTDSNVYRKLVVIAGEDDRHRYFKIEDGNHVDFFYDEFREKLRPILPCHRAAFEALEKWVEESNDPPHSRLVQNPKVGNEANHCSLGKGAEYSGPTES